MPITKKQWTAIKFALQQLGGFDLGEALEWAQNNEQNKKYGNHARAILELRSKMSDIQNALNEALMNKEVPPRPDFFLADLKTLDKTQKSQKGQHAKAIGSLLKEVEVYLTETGQIIEDEIIILVTNQTQEIQYLEALDNIKIAFLGHACHALDTGAFLEMDPVSADASCEMRVPFLLDVYDALKKNLNDNSVIVENNSLFTVPQNVIAAIDSVCLFDDVALSNTKVQRRSSSAYFGLCHPLTLIRTQALDEFGFLIDDQPNKWEFSFKQTEAMKAELSTYSVDYMRHLATVHKNLARLDNAVTMEDMIYSMFQTCNISMGKGGHTQPILPIFTAMRLILMHELSCNRPIVVTITRIGYEETDNGIIHHHYGSKAFFYRADLTSGKFIHVPEDQITDDERTQPLTNIHAFNMFDVNGYDSEIFKILKMEDQEFFYSPDWRAFEDGFIHCDITHLLRMWAAAHPPVPKAARMTLDSQEFGQEQVNFYIQSVGNLNQKGLRSYDPLLVLGDSGEKSNIIRAYIETCQEISCPNPNQVFKLPKPSLVCDGIPLLGVTSKTMNLITEYRYYKALALQYDVYEVRYAEDIERSPSVYIVDDKEVDAETYDKNAQAKKGKKSHRKETRTVYRRQSRNIPFSGVHVFLSSYNHETQTAQNLDTDNPFCTPVIDLTFVEEQNPSSPDETLKKGISRWLKN